MSEPELDEHTGNVVMVPSWDTPLDYAKNSVASDLSYLRALKRVAKKRGDTEAVRRISAACVCLEDALDRLRAVAVVAGLSVSYVAGRKEVSVTVEAVDRSEPYEPQPGDRVRHRLKPSVVGIVVTSQGPPMVLTVDRTSNMNYYAPADERWERAE